MLNHLFVRNGRPSWFDVTLVSDQGIITSPWDKLPHVITICISGDGTVEDFRRHQPRKGTCREIVDYIKNLKDVNYPRFLAH